MEVQESDKYYDVILTDVQLHAVEPTNPKPWYRVLDQAFRTKKPGRFYAKLKRNTDGKISFSLPIPPNIQQEMKAAQKAGKILRILTPKGGIPTLLSKDGEEKMKALKKAGALDTGKQ